MSTSIIKDGMSIDPDSSVQVLQVTFTGQESNYTLSTKLQSPDLSCDQYADWWEVISLGGDLVYRRNLGHSHVNEQPFSRSGGPLNISASDSVIVRGHMNNFGYGGIVMSGSVANGFTRDTIPSSFANELETLLPLPPKCAF